MASGQWLVVRDQFNIEGFSPHKATEKFRSANVYRANNAAPRLWRQGWHKHAA